MAPFVTSQPVRFAHCDPAGIGYFPAILEICDGAVEDWTAQVMGVTRQSMGEDHGFGLPTVTMQVEFARPVRLGETIDIAVTVASIGNSSINLVIAVSCEGEHRVLVDSKMVLVAKSDVRPVPWPTAWRENVLAAQAA